MHPCRGVASGPQIRRASRQANGYRLGWRDGDEASVECRGQGCQAQQTINQKRCDARCDFRSRVGPALTRRHRGAARPRPTSTATCDMPVQLALPQRLSSHAHGISPHPAWPAGQTLGACMLPFGLAQPFSPRMHTRYRVIHRPLHRLHFDLSTQTPACLAGVQCMYMLGLSHTSPSLYCPRRVGRAGVQAAPSTARRVCANPQRLRHYLAAPTTTRPSMPTFLAFFAFLRLPVPSSPSSSTTVGST